MIYEINFSHGEQRIFAETNENFRQNTVVMMSSEKGEIYGQIGRKLAENSKTPKLAKILRAADENDLEKIASTERKSQYAKQKTREIVAKSGLQMKIIETAYNMAGNQLFISFTAENRVDFRTLLKELASTFHARIELRQIGSRDAAKIYGGLGPCGRPLCCSEFLYEFPNVSIKMAKNQTLSLKQSKLNGLCGRLMCCLSYEDEFYKEAQKNFPDFGETVQTIDEKRGRVIGLNILSNTVKVRFDENIQELNVTELAGKYAR